MLLLKNCIIVIFLHLVFGSHLARLDPRVPVISDHCTVLLLQCMYLAFLLLYSYVILFDFRPTMRWTESVMIGWMLTMLLEEIREVPAIPTSFKHVLFFENFTLFYISYYCMAMLKLWSAWGRELKLRPGTIVGWAFGPTRQLVFSFE